MSTAANKANPDKTAAAGMPGAEPELKAVKPSQVANPAVKPPSKPQAAAEAKTQPKPQAKPTPKPAAKPPPAPLVIEVPPMANPTRLRRRHWGIGASFVLLVLLPALLVGYYLFAIAADQYESRVGFAVRAEESQSALDVLGGLTGLSSASSSDTDILYEYIQSQEMVERMDAQLDLRTMFSRPKDDPVFALGEQVSIEQLMAYWPRMLKVYYDGGSGLIEVRAFAFTAAEAQQLSAAVYAEASRKINALSAIARADATRYAAEERDKAITRLIAARKALTAFRIETQIVDPSADIAGQMGLLNTLQAQLADALIEQDVLLDNSRAGDPRLQQVVLRIQVIEARIAAERQKLGVGNGNGQHSYAQVVGDFEELQVDLQFAETAYLTSLGAYDAALSEAQRTSRYLTTYLRPTRAETATAPNRELLSFLVTAFLMVIWFILLLIYYSLRDRR